MIIASLGVLAITTVVIQPLLHNLIALSQTHLQHEIDDCAKICASHVQVLHQLPFCIQSILDAQKQIITLLQKNQEISAKLAAAESRAAAAEAAAAAAAAAAASAKVAEAAALAQRAALEKQLQASAGKANSITNKYVLVQLMSIQQMNFVS
jgi:hypothetical protein